MKTYRERFFGLKSDSRQTRDQGVHVQRGVKSHLRPGLKVFLTVFLLLFGFALSAGPAMAFTEGASNNFFGDGAGASNSGDNLNSFLAEALATPTRPGTATTFLVTGLATPTRPGTSTPFWRRRRPQQHNRVLERLFWQLCRQRQQDRELQLLFWHKRRIRQHNW